MTFFKNIFFVSYLKNKGIRRICFILGFLVAIIPFTMWYVRIDQHFYNLSFNNINEVTAHYGNHPIIARHIFRKYPIEYESELQHFEYWRDFFFNSYTEEYKDRKQLIKMCNDAKQRLVCIIIDKSSGRFAGSGNASKFLAGFRKLYPQYNDIPDGVLIEKLSAKYGNGCLQPQDSILDPVQPVEEPPANDYWQQFEKVQPEDFSKKVEYRITAPDGRKFVITGGETPPTQEQVRALIANYQEPEEKMEFKIQAPDGSIVTVEQEILEFCKKFGRYIEQPIHVSSYDFAYILELWGVIVAFYFPFLFCCLIRWIYMGFKEK